MKRMACWLVAACICSVCLAAQSRPEAENDPLDLKSYDCATHLELADLEDGRSDIATVWAHGYYSGMRGVDEQSEPGSSTSIDAFSEQLLKICGGDPETLFISAVKQIARAKPAASRP